MAEVKNKRGGEGEKRKRKRRESPPRVTAATQARVSLDEKKCIAQTYVPFTPTKHV